MAVNYFDGERGNPGTLVSGTDSAGAAKRFVIPAVTLADATGNAVPAGTTADPAVNKPVGGATLATNQVAVATSSTLVVAARAGRQSVTISSTTAVVYYLGANGVTIANGLYVAAAAGASITLNTAAAVYAIGASAVTLSYLENY